MKIKFKNDEIQMYGAGIMVPYYLGWIKPRHVRSLRTNPKRGKTYVIRRNGWPEPGLAELCIYYGNGYTGGVKMVKINPDFIEAFTPPPYSDLSLRELREAVGKNVTILINFPETVFYGGYEKTKNYAIELLKSDPSYNKMIGFTEMGMMGVNDKSRSIFEDGFQAIVDAIDSLC